MLKDKEWMRRTCVLVLSDAVLIAGSYGLALLARFDFQSAQVTAAYWRGFSYVIPPCVALSVLVFFAFRLYHSIWKFASVNELLKLCGAWACLQGLLFCGSFLCPVPMPRTFWVLGGLFAFLSTTALRFSYRIARLVARMLRHRRIREDHVMVIGAGEAGQTIIREFSISDKLHTQVVCIIDDDPAKQGRYIDGIPIVGGRDRIVHACRSYDISKIVVAIPSASPQQRKAILALCEETDCKVQTVPGLYQLVDGEVSISQIRDVDIQDLLGRDQVAVQMDEIRAFIEGKVVLVTGGGGSIGSELCRQVFASRPKQLIIFDIYENNAYAIQQELLRRYGRGIPLVTLIGSVRDARRVNAVFAQYRPDIVFHAAAHKHVPLMEDAPNETIKNNVLGTQKVASAAYRYGTSRFVLISTDKAVNPTNIMGASKRLCEMIIQRMARKAAREHHPTRFVAVRFGNVLGSNGSVIPLFKQQIREGGPVTVTDPRIIRYFMTIPEAVSLVLQAGCYAGGGEIFVLDMGEPVKIDDMARKLIRLSGLTPDVDIEVRYTGLRPGEKLYEEMLMSEEGLRETPNHLIHIGEPIDMDDAQFAKDLATLARACREESAAIKAIVARIVPTYTPDARNASRN